MIITIDVNTDDKTQVIQLYLIVCRLMDMHDLPKSGIAEEDIDKVLEKSFTNGQAPKKRGRGRPRKDSYGK